MIEIKGKRLVIHQVIEAPYQLVWKIITDTEQWSEWGPSVRDVESAERYIRLGSSGRVKTVLGFWLSFHITSYEELVFWSWRVSSVNATGHRLTPMGEQCSRLSFDMPWWALPYLLVCYAALKRIGRMCRKVV